jgi:hypothetical protein
MSAPALRQSTPRSAAAHAQVGDGFAAPRGGFLDDVRAHEPQRDSRPVRAD